MGIIHTGLGAVNIVPVNPADLFTQVSRLTQTFQVTAGQALIFKLFWKFFSNEFPTQSTVFNDTFRVRLVDPLQTSTTFVTESRNTSFTAATVSPGTASTTDLPNNFTIFQGNGVTPFKNQTFMPWVPLGSGEAMAVFEIFDRSDTAVDSGAAFDMVSLATDPPLYFFGRGDTLTRTQREPLLSLTSAPQTFDSLMMVCCEGRVTLAGPLLHAVDSDLNVPFGLLSVFQGGTLSTSSTEPLARLDGGTHSFGSAGLAMFGVSGAKTATDAETGLTLGTDKPLQHAGPLLETSGATVKAHQVVRLDTALLEATAPLLALRNKSQFTSTADAVELSYQAKVTSLGSLVRLDASTLTVASGAALNVAGGSVMRVTGDLFSLSNGSSLRLLNGPLLSLSGSSMLSVTGALVAFGGSGGNTLSVANSLCPCTSIAGLPVSLTGGALASNISITGAIKNPTLGSINLSSPNAALIQVNGAGTKLTINGL